MGLQPLQQDVGGYLKNDVRNEEDSQGGIILRSSQLEVLLQAKDRGISDISAIEEREKVEDAQDRDDAEIDFGDQSALSGVWRALDL